MKIGIVFPQTEFGSDPIAIRDYVQTAEALGYNHVLAYDHVLGANPVREGGWNGPYTHNSTFHDPFVLFSYMAGLTNRIEFATGILILPQRQTAVVAKQAATLDLLSNGRFRLGVGTGWNPIEYQALGQNFHTRGKRLDAQIKLLRQLWSGDLLQVDDDWHFINDASLNPTPTRPIPIWFGGYVDIVLRRIAAVGDGWMPGHSSAEKAAADLEKLDRYLAENGRSRADIGIEPRTTYGDGDAGRWQAVHNGWQAAGATHFSVHTMNAGLNTPAKHIAAIEHFAKAMGV